MPIDARFAMSLGAITAACLAAGAIAAATDVEPVRAAIALSATPSPARAVHFGTLPPGASGLPRDEAWCAWLVAPHPWEPRPDNAQANAVVPPTGAVSWADTPAQTHWRRWIANRDSVTGNYTGTTDQILRWGACRWGINENTIRAVAMQESEWHQSTVGDGGQSFGIMQVKDHDADGTPAWGGYPWTQTATALNVDFYAAAIRSCLDGDFYDGGPWLYRGQTVAQVIARHGQAYARWGCVGWWYSGRWYDRAAVHYIDLVKGRLAAKGWLRHP